MATPAHCPACRLVEFKADATAARSAGSPAMTPYVTAGLSAPIPSPKTP
jgi:hypothetical protein